MHYNRTVFARVQTFINVRLRHVEINFAAHRHEARPKFILHDERKNFFVSERVLVAEYDEFFAVFNHQRNVFAEDTERRISDDNISFLEQFNTFF